MIVLSTKSTCHALCLADSFPQEKLRKYFNKQAFPKLQSCPDYLFIQQDDGGEAVIFLHGCIVFWGVDGDSRADLIKKIRRLSIEPYKHPVDEVYNIQQGDEVSIIESDLFLDSDAVDAKIAISYALAQAVKLKHYEDILSDTMPDLLTLPSELAKKGKIGISKKKALKKTGEIFLVRTQINLHSDLLDTPEYFWERTDREEDIYNLVIMEMELRKRVRKLNHRLDIMQSTYDLLRAHIEHKDSILLEQTIIVLIALEIIFTVIQYVWPAHIH